MKVFTEKLSGEKLLRSEQARRRVAPRSDFPSLLHLDFVPLPVFSEPLSSLQFLILPITPLASKLTATSAKNA
jgi:hypothetical protein